MQPTVSVISHIFLEVTCLHFLHTQIILFPSWVSEGVEDFIVVVKVSLSFIFRKKNLLKKYKIYKAESHKKVILVMQVRIESEIGIIFWTHQDIIDVENFL